MSSLVEHVERSQRRRGIGQLVYLAYPIDQAGGGDWMEHSGMGLVRAWFHERGIGVYDPGAAWTVGAQQTPDRRVQSVNNLALGRADAVVAFLPPGVPTIGVPIEIQKAAQSGIPVLIIGGGDSWALAGYANYPWVKIGHEFESVADCLDWLVATAVEAKQERRPEVLPFKQVRVQPASDEKHAVLPQRQYDGDAGFDLVVSRSSKVPPGEMVDVPCNLAVELPEWSWGLIVGRSSTLRTKRLQVHLGVVDSGYRGELFAAVSSLPGVAETVEVQAGERLAQLILMTNNSRGVVPALVDRLGDSDRGERGFGSSGR